MRKMNEFTQSLTHLLLELLAGEFTDKAEEMAKAEGVTSAEYDEAMVSSMATALMMSADKAGVGEFNVVNPVIPMTLVLKVDEAALEGMQFDIPVDNAANLEPEMVTQLIKEALANRLGLDVNDVNGAVVAQDDEVLTAMLEKQGETIQ